MTCTYHRLVVPIPSTALVPLLEALKSSTSDARSGLEGALMSHMLNETINHIPWLTAWRMASPLVLVMPRSTRKSTASFAIFHLDSITESVFAVPAVARE
jgi:hypothetical protein